MDRLENYCVDAATQTAEGEITMKNYYVMGCIRCAVEADSKEAAEEYISTVLENIGTYTDSRIAWMAVEVSDVGEVQL